MKLRILSISFLLVSLTFSNLIKADEGMWLPLLIKRLNHTDMQKMGLKLTAEEIYSVNNSSLKDAIVNFGNFCTGELISSEGLILTNHHCGYDAIQSHSSVEHDYLSDGFWAMNREQELPNAGLTVTFLVRMEDVTQQLVGKTEEEKETIQNNLIKEAIGDSHYTAEIKSFFEGNEYYMFVYEVYTDVRLVGAPPSSVGKFGGDTDNWMWPRHTGDFSIFRVYTGKDGKPAEYSKDNIPLTPRHHLPVSLKGIQKGDFTMVMGYPGGTDRYMCSEGVKLAYDQSNPARIKIREKKLEIIKEDMDADKEVRIKYASKYAKVSNYYKYFIGQNQGLKRLDVIDKKQAEEKKFQEWVDADTERKKLYGNVLKEFDDIYKEYRKVNLPYIYLEEAAFGTEILLMAYKFNTLHQALSQKLPKEDLDKITAGIQVLIEEHFKDYNAPTDKKVFAKMLKMYYNDIDPSLHPSIFKEVEKKYEKDFKKFAKEVFKSSIFASKEKLEAFLKKPNLKVLEKDLAFKTMNSILGDFRAKSGPSLRNVYQRLEENNSLYIKGIMDMRKDKKLYPDANFTMRLTYGSVLDYDPRDAVHYHYMTTLEGIMEKEDPKNDEFIVPKKLKSLYKKKDYGQYADKNGKMPVCFISNNDITGGNSGSPVINGEGHLIGTAFDGNWEAMSGDIAFEPELQRCISVDIRYVLFMIDKFAGAEHLIKEMTIVK